MGQAKIHMRPTRGCAGGGAARSFPVSGWRDSASPKGNYRGEATPGGIIPQEKSLRGCCGCCGGGASSGRLGDQRHHAVHAPLLGLMERAIGGGEQGHAIGPFLREGRHATLTVMAPGSA